MSRVQLDKITALTFYEGELTKARRSRPIQQLSCQGSICKQFTPPAVDCQNIGGSGADVDWECTADLPEHLRFGRAEVSCEGFAQPGDPYVLEGSCGLEYRLVEVPGMRKTGSREHDSAAGFDSTTAAFCLAFLVVLVCIWILYRVWKSWVDNCPSTHRRPSPARATMRQSRLWDWPGWETNPAARRPEPNPAVNPSRSWSSSDNHSEVANYLWNRNANIGPATGTVRQSRSWDSETKPAARRLEPSPAVNPSRSLSSSDNHSEVANRNVNTGPATATVRQSHLWDSETKPAARRPEPSPAVSSSRSWFASSDNRGEGSSSGVMRPSTGYARTNVR